jgi:hypothetical protein
VPDVLQPNAIVFQPATILFSPAIPVGYWVSDTQCVCGPLVFSQPLDPAGCSFAVDLVANGTNEPTFPNMTAASWSQPWLNTPGAVNSVSIGYETRITGFPATQSYGIQNFPSSGKVLACVISIECVHGNNPTITISTGGLALNPEYVPNVSRFAVTRIAGNAPPETPSTAIVVATVSLTSSSITLSLQEAVEATDVVTLSYAPLWPGLPPYDLSVTDTNGNLLAAITNASVTVS